MRKVNSPLMAAGIAASLTTAIAAYNWPEQAKGCRPRCLEVHNTCMENPEHKLKGICWKEYRKCDQKCLELVE